MPGAYAHLTAALIASERERLAEAFEGDREVVGAINNYADYYALGAVGPDYPYLKILSSSSKEWADTMHYERTGQRLKHGIAALREIGPDVLVATEKAKAVAWLLGFASHVVMDVTIHPVVELKVGPYKGNETAHRECEMHQDVYIFQKKVNGGTPGQADRIAREITSCHDPNNDEALDPAVKDIWHTMLQRCDLPQYSDTPPDMDSWHKNFIWMVDNVAEEGDNLFSFARHMAEEAALVYPQVADEARFVDTLEVPGGEAMRYDDIFDKGVENVLWMWNMVYRAVFKGDVAYQDVIRDWNLDTGRRESESGNPDEPGELEFWG